MTTYTRLADAQTGQGLSMEAGGWTQNPTTC